MCIKELINYSNDLDCLINNEYLFLEFSPKWLIRFPDLQLSYLSDLIHPDDLTIWVNYLEDLKNSTLGLKKLEKELESIVSSTTT